MVSLSYSIASHIINYFISLLCIYTILPLGIHLYLNSWGKECFEILGVFEWFSLTGTWLKLAFKWPCHDLLTSKWLLSMTSHWLAHDFEWPTSQLISDQYSQVTGNSFIWLSSHMEQHQKAVDRLGRALSENTITRKILFRETVKARLQNNPNKLLG